MANGETITVVGNLGGDPELRFTPSGLAVCSFSLGSTPRKLNKETNTWEDGDTNWYRCQIWREAGENAAESLQRGMRVIVVGRLQIRQYDDKEGVKRTSVEIQVDDFGPALKNATAKVTKVDRKNTQSGGFGGGGNADPWASAAPAPGGFGGNQGGGGFGGNGKGSNTYDTTEEPPF